MDDPESRVFLRSPEAGELNLNDNPRPIREFSRIRLRYDGRDPVWGTTTPRCLTSGPAPPMG
eukprot:1502319-Prymnesium_polylepis.1